MTLLSSNLEQSHNVIFLRDEFHLDTALKE
jgi:hypothetical protein